MFLYFEFLRKRILYKAVAGQDFSLEGARLKRKYKKTKVI